MIRVIDLPPEALDHAHRNRNPGGILPLSGNDNRRKLMTRRLHFAVIVRVTAALAIFVPMASAQCLNDGSGEAIQCRMGNVLSKNSNLISTLQQKISSCDSTDAHCAALQRHLARVQNAHNRAVNAHNHANADNYNQLTASPHYHRNSKHTAGTSSTQSAGGNSNTPDTLDSDYDPTGTGSAGQTISDSLDDASSAIDDANSTLASTPVPPPPPFTPPDVYDFTTDIAYPQWLHKDTDEVGILDTRFAAKMALSASESLEGVMEHFCDETIVFGGEGGNTKVGCIAAWLLVSATRATADFLEFADSDKLYWTAKGGYVNAQRALTAVDQIGQIAAGTSGDVGDIKAKVDAIALYIDSTLTPDLNKILANQVTILANQATILGNQATIMQLLSTPQGQRPAFPTK